MAHDGAPMHPPVRCVLAAVACVLVSCGEQRQTGSEQPRVAAHDSSAALATEAHDEDAGALRPIMQHLGLSMSGLQQALWLEDYDAMAVHAAAISGHVHLSDDELARIRTELGDEMVAFEAADSTVHEAAVRLRAAVEARDLDATVGELGTVQAGCVSCHSAFRDRLRTDSLAR